MPNNPNTFSRLVAAGMRWARGDLANKLTSAVAGLMPDAIADGVRQVIRLLLPLDGSPVDALPAMFVRFGLPPYAPGVMTYRQQIARLQNMLSTHSNAGSMAQMAAELTSMGVTDVSFIVEANGFSIQCDNVTPLIVGAWTIGDDARIGATVKSTAITQSIVQMLEYFAPDFLIDFVAV